MKDIQDCLADFSVAAMVNTPDAEERGKAAVAAYLECTPPELHHQLAALHKLYAAYLELALDSKAALAIKDDIKSRIVELAVMPPELVAPDRHAYTGN